MEDDRLHCSVEVPYLLYVPVVCLVVGFCWLGGLAVLVTLQARAVVRARRRLSRDYHPPSVGLDRLDSHAWKNLSDEYEEIPEEYRDLGQGGQQPASATKTWRSSVEHESPSDNLAQEADAMLRILANPEIFQRARAASQQEENKRKKTSNSSISSLMEDAFRISGFVAASTIQEEDEEEAEVREEEREMKETRRMSVVSLGRKLPLVRRMSSGHKERIHTARL